ncbi:MAG: DUF2202 domain-containing protein [Deltaproteobacteria bacterium]|nr:DUF2202 domain-containing protein [Deltaproteobacteria bacterium]
MKILKHKFMTLALMLALGLLNASLSYGQGTCSSCAISALNAAEISTLQYMYDEEGVAGDFYLAMNALWQQKAFSSIAAAEKKHAAALLKQLSVHGITPIAGLDPNLVVIKEEVINRGSLSLLDAYMAAGLVEEQDISDLKLAMAATKAPELIKVYGDLKKASENHLRAVAKNVTNLGGQYVAQLLPENEVNTIIGVKSGKGPQSGNQQNRKQGANKQKGKK